MTGWLVAWTAGMGIAVVAHRARMLTRGGAVAAAIVGGVLFGVAGWSGAVPLLVFFVSSSLLSKVVDRRVGEEADAKGSTRDAMQVVANGGAATLCAAAGGLGLTDAWYLGIVGALSAAAADTWATDVGRLFGWTPRRVTTGRPVAVGTSGGVSLPGFLGSLAGASVVVASSWPWLSGPDHAARLVLVGFVAAVVDSVLGDTVQARFRVSGGGIREHVQGAAELVSGWRWMDNDGVNVAMTVFGAVAGIILA